MSDPTPGAPRDRIAVIRCDARHLPLPERSVDLIVCSPPYYGQRDYRDADDSLTGQIGAEPTPGEYVDDLIACTREWMRVLKPTGSLFVLLGDKYSSAKSRLLLPERYRLACSDLLGLKIRAVISWEKRNGKPESVTDRVRASHEDLVHLTTRGRYYAAIDDVRVPHTGRLTPVIQPLSERQGPVLVPGNTPHKTPGRDGLGSHPLGKLPGSVWDIPVRPLRVPRYIAHARCCEGTDPGCGRGVRHDAPFPPDLVRRIILGWSPPGGLVVDPFGGTGTTALVASIHDRRAISFDLSHDYGRLARWRTTDPAEQARACARPKSPPVSNGQDHLFEGIA